MGEPSPSPLRGSGLRLQLQQAAARLLGRRRLPSGRRAPSAAAAPPPHVVFLVVLGVLAVVHMLLLLSQDTARSSPLLQVPTGIRHELRRGRAEADHQIGNATGAAVGARRLTVVLDDALRNDVPTVRCPYRSFRELTPEDRRHLAATAVVPTAVAAPPDGPRRTLVCCGTTAGPWSVVVEHTWAPHGARRFLDMVRAGYYRRKVPLMRCVARWLCQFGLAGAHSRDWEARISDDPPVVLPGNHSALEAHFPAGFLSFAGSGPKSRARQLFVALSDRNAFGRDPAARPWELPIGRLVGPASFAALRQTYAGYGEEGPDQNRLLRTDALAYTLEEFPRLDYITDCRVLDEE